MNNLTQDNWTPGPDFNSGPPVYKAGYYILNHAVWCISQSINKHFVVLLLALVFVPGSASIFNKINILSLCYLCITGINISQDRTILISQTGDKLW
jgi:hypothetical protein